MQRNPRIGDRGEVRFQVSGEHAIDFADSDLPAVLSTPWLIWFLEHAAREAVLPCLDNHESTVGIQVDVQHLAATPVGQSVTCRARIVHVDGTRLSFQLEAYDAAEVIARGMHQLRVIDKQRFAARVHAKRDATQS